jgi:putative nucleotidyltransferase with HDIG domain
VSSAHQSLAAVEVRDGYTGAHSQRVSTIAVALGKELGLAAAELDQLGHAALLHDIGKLTIPDEILLKPASLTEDEWELMRTHSVEGARMVGELDDHAQAAPAIRHHHERFDGAGYPDGLAGEEIPLAARIIHVADAVDSMLTTRIYRPGRPPRAALAELHRESGTQFCPRCVAALVELVRGGVLESLGVPSNALVAAVPREL